MYLSDQSGILINTLFLQALIYFCDTKNASVHVYFLSFFYFLLRQLPLLPGGIQSPPRLTNYLTSCAVVVALDTSGHLQSSPRTSSGALSRHGTRVEISPLRERNYGRLTSHTGGRTATNGWMCVKQLTDVCS